jgi:hypothetical protein
VNFNEIVSYQKNLPQNSWRRNNFSNSTTVNGETACNYVSFFWITCSWAFNPVPFKKKGKRTEKKNTEKKICHGNSNRKPATLCLFQSKHSFSGNSPME